MADNPGGGTVRGTRRDPDGPRDPTAAPAQALPRLIEEWLPVQELGIEARRENSTGQHPPPNRLHVWWARRPLVVSRAAVLASLLPARRPDWPEPLRQRFPTREAYHAWVLHLLGIRGDAVRSRQIALDARARGERLQLNPFDYPRAFTCSPTEDELRVLADLLKSSSRNSRDGRLVDELDWYGGCGDGVSGAER